MGTVFGVLGDGERKERKDGPILYHYTSRRAAESITQSGIIRSGADGILLTKMAPERYYRNEILFNNYGENVPTSLQNRADYCVRVLPSKLIDKHLTKKQLDSDRLIYLYAGDIHVKQLDVFDKPICNRRMQASQSHVQQPSSSRSSCLVTDESHVASKKPRSRKMTEIKMELRRDIKLSQIGSQEHQDGRVTIFAFEWIKEGLKRIRKALDDDDLVVNVADSTKYLIADGDFSLKDLQILARNESSNTNGLINFRNYNGISKELIYSLKDLSRQSVIVGHDITTSYGGCSNDNERVPQIKSVYVCDLSGLQFQQPYNSGRLVLVGKDLPVGVLDKFIYEHVVNEKKPTVDDARSDHSGRFIERLGVYFDSKAYVKFVANDVVLAGIALNSCATEPLNFKFLKYGTGFFAGPFRQLLDRFIGQGVADGLENLLRHLPANHHIKAIELPFFDQCFAIDTVCLKYNVELKYSKDDALKYTRFGYTTATTNSADPHGMAGNRMGFGSVDGAIAENLRGKAVKFSPIVNELMTECFVKH